MPKILVVDDERAIRNALRDILEYEKYEVEEAEDGMDGIEKAMKGGYDLILCDIKMPKMDGLELLEKLQTISSDTPIIMISGHANIDTAVECIKNGAFDFIQKPLDLNRVLITLRNAMEKGDLVEETKVLRKKVQKKQEASEMLGESAAMMEIKSMIERVAPKDARVLINGENGTGKELVARQIHKLSERAGGPFVEVNCAAIPSELIESELFGHEKGAFTSAHKQRQGKFEQAENGTLFLDEIGDMSLAAQAKVLRALQEHKITRVGGDKDIKVNVRVLAATNKNLRQMIDDGEFREDLFHRLSVIVIEVPSLNERAEDIPMLVDHFVTEICQEHGSAKKEFDASAIKALQEVNWTGNIRELRNIVERLIILGEEVVTKTDVQTFANKK